MAIHRQPNSETTSQESKQQILDKVLGDDKSDIAKKLRLTCEALTADPKIKEKVWKELVDPKSTLSVYERRAYMQGFYNGN